MQPYKDKDDGNLGVALFFSVLFDKLIIGTYQGPLFKIMMTNSATSS
jgi:hypothetical protein